MDKESYSWGGIGFLALFFLIIVAQWGRGANGFGWGNNGCGNGFVPFGDGIGFGASSYGFQNYRATCDAEKAEIINTATTQYKTIEQSQLTRDVVNASANTTQAKIDFYAYQDLRDKLSESQRENMMLQNKLFVKDQLAPITSQLTNIQYTMLRKPEVAGLSTSCNPIITPALYGWNNCGCNGNVLV